MQDGHLHNHKTSACLHCESLFFISPLYQILQPGLDYVIEIQYFRFPSLIIIIRFIVCPN